MKNSIAAVNRARLKSDPLEDLMLKITSPDPKNTMENSRNLLENKEETNNNTNNNNSNDNNNINNNNNNILDRAKAITDLPIIKEEIPFLNSVMIKPEVTHPYSTPPYYISPSNDIKDKLELTDPMTCFCISARHLLLGTSSPFSVL